MYYAPKFWIIGAMKTQLCCPGSQSRRQYCIIHQFIQLHPHKKAAIASFISLAGSCSQIQEILTTFTPPKLEPHIFLFWTEIVALPVSTPNFLFVRQVGSTRHRNTSNYHPTTRYKYVLKYANHLVTFVYNKNLPLLRINKDNHCGCRQWSLC